jgi:hypothetical protein
MTLPAELAEPPLLYPCAVIFAPDLTVTVTLSAEAPLIPWEVPVTFPVCGAFYEDGVV